MVTIVENASDQLNISVVSSTGNKQYLVLRNPTSPASMSKEHFNADTGITMRGEAAALNWIVPDMSQPETRTIRLWYTVGWKKDPTGVDFPDPGSVTLATNNEMEEAEALRGSELCTTYLTAASSWLLRSADDITRHIASRGDLIGAQLGLPNGSVVLAMSSVGTTNNVNIRGPAYDLDKQRWV
ncbi:hypothetical protein TREMEDRAFT_63523 [Tremella mesenterica DSM 1558]|uniref:uncharacterized protein n=1 Tax=Tremella mesenterica (strain ATCC 24925 / CBS 8224 / DSM 1558 / NBRC 9311 / NRRL Y-6157 / RJB 2259-6 / UBC 559-6) TaxID=578456 RepID=UPI0003F49A33|nr:uncharacterized protein TREMEDRAFT_63523 [Tremella mesenterica DSM 1558]EIW68353.1 hypothetical protein TREMEDRAFT_63523 [Tremella mesenterica DSM 1558]